MEREAFHNVGLWKDWCEWGWG